MLNDKDFAMVIGVNDYKQLPPLKGPVTDAESFRDWLISPTGGGLPKDNCKFIPSGKDPFKPIQDDIDDELEEIISLDDGSFRRFYFFFAGHGIGVTWDVNGLCLPKWTDIQRNYALSSKSYLNYIIGSSIFPEVYFFMDCCRYRTVSADPSNTRLGNIIGRGTAVSSVVVYATPFDNPANEAPVTGTDGSLTRGFFSRALVEGLEGAAADDAGNITAPNLIDFTKRRTDELAKAEGKSQMVNADISDGGRDPDTLWLRTGVPVQLAQMTFRFALAGTYRLLGPNLTVLHEEAIAAGSTWAPIGLKKGIYILLEVATNKKNFIEVNGTENQLDHDFS